MHPETRRLRTAAAALTLLSGALMMTAGYVGATATWTAAAPVTIPGGIVILGALALAGRAERVDGQAVATGGRRFARLATMTVVLAAGGVMVLAGYATAEWSPALALALAMLGGVVIGGVRPQPTCHMTRNRSGRSAFARAGSRQPESRDARLATACRARASGPGQRRPDCRVSAERRFGFPGLPSARTR
jgi:hypothetical protein